ncbi:hypothetical protein N7470_010362 [Penicillium chermesinum]|nr:hypothetical protein N7470_010362 [Penicillium chermesinum]
MASFIKKIKRKRRLSSELHDRWGDPSISYPNDGSWNQWNQQAGFMANATIPHARDNERSRRHASPSTSPGSPDPTHTTAPFPTGYYNENIRRSDNSGTTRGLGITTPSRHGSHGSKAPTEPEDSCDEDEERDTLGDDPERAEFSGII